MGEWNNWFDYFVLVILCVTLNSWFLGLVAVVLDAAGFGVNYAHIYNIILLPLPPIIVPLFTNYFWGEGNLSKKKSIRKGRALALVQTLNADILSWRISNNPSAIEIEMGGYVYGYLETTASYVIGFSGTISDKYKLIRKYYSGPSWLIEEWEGLNRLRSSNMVDSKGLEAIKSFELGLGLANVEVRGYLFEGLDMPTGLGEYIRAAPNLNLYAP